MARVVDITEKLSFDENPRLVIKDQEFEVNADAATVLKMMGAFKDKGEVESVIEMYELLFGEEARNAIEGMGLPFKDLRVIIETVMGLVIGEDDAEGEPGTRTTTS